jgi:hypothetical protein
VLKAVALTGAVREEVGGGGATTGGALSWVLGQACAVAGGAMREPRSQGGGPKGAVSVRQLGTLACHRIDSRRVGEWR